MSFPGPSGIWWALSLLFFAVLFLPAGECLRRLAARFAPFARAREPVERLLLDFYLGGALLYAVAAVPLGLFGLPSLVLVLGGSAFLLILLEVRGRGRRAREVPTDAPTTRFRRLVPAALALALFLFLFGVETWVAEGIPTGNTFDGGLLTTYTSLLLSHGTIPLSLRPLAPQGVVYPQGTTVWLGAAQLLFGLPPARLSLLVTPLFLALSVPGGFVVGRRLFGSDVAGATVAGVFALVGSWTRVLVAGSNDFCFAFPLFLLLLAWAPRWAAERLPTWGDGILFGVLAGYSAAINPVGAEILFPTLGILALVTRPGLAGRLLSWAGRWLGSLAAALLFVLPSVVVLISGRASPGWTPGAAPAPATGPPGIGPAEFVGLTDPLLFGPSNVWLSPIPFLRAELALLIVGGAALLLGALPFLRPAPAERAVGRLLLAAGTVSVLLLLGYLALRAGAGALLFLDNLSSASEISIVLFTLYTILAAVPVARAAEHLRTLDRSASGARGNVPPAPATGHRPRRELASTVVALALVACVGASGTALTAVVLPPVLSEQYAPFSNVSAADFALLEWAGTHLPAGARVLVAPGSAAGFLPGYVRGIELVYPMGPVANNATYQELVRLLQNGTLGPTGERDMAILGIGYVAVTGENNRLWLPFSPAPLLRAPGYPLLFEEGDAYLFARA